MAKDVPPGPPGDARKVDELRAAREAHRERHGDGGGIGSPLRDPRELDELATHPGLCATCVHLRLMRSPRSTFVRCALAESDDRFPRYPRLPVVACAGHTVRGATTTTPDVGAGLAAARDLGGPEDLQPAGDLCAAGLLHVTNGDSVLEGFAAGGIPGDALAWRDVLHDGPVPATATLEELSEIRARALAGFGWGSYPQLRRDFARRDATLRGARARREVVLWFEHDLYDQLQLLQILDFFARHGSGAARLSLIEIDRFPGVEPFHGLGQLAGDQLATLLPRRQPVTARQLALAAETWAEVRAPDPMRMAARAQTPMPELPFLAAALRRLCEEYPALGDGLARSERQVLSAVAAGARDEPAVVQRVWAMEDVPWGDSTILLRVATLLAAPVPPLVRGARGLELTTTGLRALRGEEDFVVTGGGVDRWIGGVHLCGRAVRWRWDPRAAALVTSGGRP